MKLSKTPAYPQSLDPSSYDYKKDSEDPHTTEYIRLDLEWRQMIDVDCDKAGYPENGGNKYCTVYLAVECSDQCAYRISLDMENRNNLN